MALDSGTTTTLEFVIQASSMEALQAEADEYVRTLVRDDVDVRFSDVVVIAVGEKSAVDGEFTYELSLPAKK
jgi:hypothetical protein